MTDYCNQEREISLVDIFALCLRKFVVLGLCALIGAAVAVGVHINKVNKSSEGFDPAPIEKALLEKRAELEEVKEVKKMENELRLAALKETVSYDDYSKAVGLFTSLDSNIKKFENEIEKLEDQLNPAEPSYSIANYAVIGFFAGGFVSLIWIVIVFIAAEPVTRSEDSKARLDAPLLGAVFSENGCFEKLSRKAMGEVCWKDKATALRWFEENLDSTVLPDKAKVAVLYSGNNAKALEAVKDVLAVLKKKGYEVTFTENAALNPETNAKVQDSDAVLLFEKQWTSKWKYVCACEEIAQRFEKKTAGFVLC